VKQFREPSGVQRSQRAQPVSAPGSLPTPELRGNQQPFTALALGGGYYQNSTSQSNFWRCLWYDKMARCRALLLNCAPPLSCLSHTWQSAVMLDLMPCLIRSHSMHFICHVLKCSVRSISAVIGQAFEKQKRLARMTLPKLAKVQKIRVSSVLAVPYWPLFPEIAIFSRSAHVVIHMMLRA